MLGIDYYLDKANYKKWAPYWVYFFAIICMYIPCVMPSLDNSKKEYDYQMSIKIFNNTLIIAVLVFALCRIQKLLGSVPQVA